MKKILFFVAGLVLSIALTGCSKDDDSGTVTNKQKLIDGGTWNFQSVQVLEIIDDDTEVTMQEMQSYLNDYFDFTYSYRFFSDNKVTIKYDYTTINDTYTISNDAGQDNFTLDLANYSTYTNCKVSSTFIFEVIEYVGMPWGEEVTTLLRYTFN